MICIGRCVVRVCLETVTNLTVAPSGFPQNQRTTNLATAAPFHFITRWYNYPTVCTQFLAALLNHKHINLRYVIRLRVTEFNTSSPRLPYSFIVISTSGCFPCEAQEGLGYITMLSRDERSRYEAVSGHLCAGRYCSVVLRHQRLSC
jgi:hypothetical protein